MNAKRKKVQDYILKIMKLIDKTNTNYNYYVDFFKKMSDTQFDQYMKLIRDRKMQLYVYFPNLKVPMVMEDFLKAAKETGTKIFHRLKIKDKATGEIFLTEEEYPVLVVSVRRLQQFLDKKMSVPDSDTTIDGLTGQVTGDDRSSGLSNPEIQCLFARGLNKTLEELIKVRGGDIHAYGEFKRQAEEIGTVSMERISKNSKTRSVVIADVLMRGMHLDTNFAE